MRALTQLLQSMYMDRGYSLLQCSATRHETINEKSVCVASMVAEEDHQKLRE